MLKKLVLSIIILLLSGCTNYEINTNTYNDSIYLNIEKININNKISISSIKEEVNGIVMFLEYSMPDEEGNIVIGAHSGYGPNAYFNDIHLLEKEDTIIMDYYGKKYTYQVELVKEVDDTFINILEEKKEKKLILISCKLNDDSKRIVVFASETVG